MSSILKALKKIEGRKVDRSLPAWPYGTGSPESMDSHIHRSRQRQKILGLLIILCAAALAGKLYIGSRSESVKTEPESAVSQSVPKTAADLPERPAEASKPEAQKIVKIKPESTQEPASKEAPSETAQAPAISPPSAEEAPFETEAMEVIAPLPVKPEETATVEKTPTATVTDSFGSPPLDNADLTLMALVWSQRPESRFVVINGTIVREGGSIEESTVVRIEEDYAVMRTGGVTWKLK